MNLQTSQLRNISFVLVAILVSYAYFHVASVRYQSVTSFDTCITAGYPVSVTYPETCKMPGKVFVNLRQKKADIEVIQEIPEKDINTISYFYEGQEIPFSDGKGILLRDSSGVTSTTTFLIHASSSLLVHFASDEEQDTVLLISTPSPQTAYGTQDFYLAVAVKLYHGYVGSSMIKVGTSNSSPSLVYKNGSILVSFRDGTKKNYVFEKNLLREE